MVGVGTEGGVEVCCDTCTVVAAGVVVFKDEGALPAPVEDSLAEDVVVDAGDTDAAEVAGVLEIAMGFAAA